MIDDDTGNLPPSSRNLTSHTLYTSQVILHTVNVFHYKIRRVDLVGPVEYFGKRVCHQGIGTSTASHITVIYFRSIN